MGQRVGTVAGEVSRLEERPAVARKEVLDGLLRLLSVSEAQTGADPAGTPVGRLSELMKACG